MSQSVPIGVSPTVSTHGYDKNRCINLPHHFTNSDSPPKNVSPPISSAPPQLDLQQQEELLYKERKERERILAGYRKTVEEHKAQAEKVDRRVRYT